jgi:tRNA (guanine37-N1)-methyltransferase
MRFDVLTLFPELFDPFLRVGVTRRAYESRQVDVRLWQMRDYAEDNYRRVDDRPFGGGPGMVMLAAPLERALAAVKADRATAHPGVPAVIHFSPTGRRLDQALARELATGEGAILLCGRYEGIDQRVLDRHVTMEISLGDFVLSGGELPAIAMLDAIARLQDGVLNDAASHQQDSFSDGLLDCPHFSRPEVLETPEGPLPVPPVLLSGHHAEIGSGPRGERVARAVERPAEAVAAARRDGRLAKKDEKFLASLAGGTAVRPHKV